MIRPLFCPAAEVADPSQKQRIDRRSAFASARIGLCGCLAAFLLAACDRSLSTPPQSITPSTTPTPSMPQDVRDLVQRLENCRHLAGEMNGDGSARDHEVMASINKLSCRTVEADTLLLQQKYADLPTVQAALIAGLEPH